MRVSTVFLLLGSCLALSWGQDDTVIVTIPTLGEIQGRLGVTSRDQESYWTFHGIPYADSDSYTGPNRFKPSEVYEKPLTSDGSVFEANRILVYCPQGPILDLPQDPRNVVESEEDRSKAQDLVQIFRAIHQKKRERSEIYRSFTNSEERVKFFQENPPHAMGQEDCLTININTPHIPENPDDPDTVLLPVIVFWHGGGCDGVWGSAFTALRMLEGKRVLLVTMNYRLGVLGALNLGVNDAPGNLHLYDSITVLRWIKKNIKYFGGDPNLVTISGQSAGAMIVTNLLISPLAADEDLFHRVWGFSGAAINVWALSEEPSLPNHLRIAELSGCYDFNNPTDTPAIVDCMRGKDIHTLVESLSLWKHEEEIAGRLGYDARMPSIQSSPLITIPKIMPEHPSDVLEGLRQKNVPVILGATRHDGSYPLDDIYNNFLKPNGLDKNATFLKNDLLPTLLETLGIRDDTGELYHAMAKDYLGNASTTGTWEDKVPGLLDMVTAMAFKAGEYEVLKFQQRINTHSYFYSMDYYGRWSLYNFLWGEMYIPGGICHTDDLIYFFWLGPLLNEDMKVSRRWVDYFINFAYHGDPNGPPGPGNDGFWKPYDPLKHYYLSMDRHDKVIENAPAQWTGPSEELFTDWNPTVSSADKDKMYLLELFRTSRMFQD